MNRKNTIYASLALVVLIAATGLAVWYAYLTKQSVDSSRTKTFDPLVVPGSPGSDLGAFNNDEITEKSLKEKTSTDDAGKDTAGTSPDGVRIDPAGSDGDGTETKEKQQGDTGTPGTGKKGVHLFKLYEGPVAGFTFYEGPKKEIIVRLAERQRGNIIDIPLATQKNERVTNSTILGVQKAFFTKSGQHVIMQHLDTDDSVLTLSTPVTELAEKKDTDALSGVGTYLPVNIQSLLVRDETILFSTIQEDSTLSMATTNLAGERAKRIWKSPLHGWNISWSGEGVASVLVNQRPALGIPGYVYRISLTKGTLEKVYGDEPGVTTLESPKGTYILKTTSDTAGYTSSIFPKSGAAVVLRKVLIPEKCTWAPSETLLYCGLPVDMQGTSYPEAWMQGARIYADTVVTINPKTGSEAVIIETVKGSPDGLDVTQARTAPDGSHLVFIDKTTGTLWGLTLE